MGRIGVELGATSPRPEEGALARVRTHKGADFPLVLVYVKHRANRLEEAKQICRRSAMLLLVRLPTVPLSAPVW